MNAIQHVGIQVHHLASALGKYYVAYYPVLADITGSPKAALMLGYAMFMSKVVMEKHAHRPGGADGWFYKTTREWTESTGLSVREIETARKILVEHGLMYEKRQSMPARLWYRVDLDKLAQMLCQHANTTYREWSWEDRVLRTLLGKPVMFYAPFAWLANNAIAGLYMSTLFGRMRNAISTGTQLNKDGWFNSPITDSISQIRLGRHALMNARAKLISANMIEESRESKAQAKLVSRLNLETLPTLIALEANKHHSKSESDKHVSRFTTNKSSPKRESTVHQNANQEFTEPQIKNSPNSESSSAVSSTFLYKEIYPTYLNHQNHVAGTEPALLNSVEVDFNNLHYPDNILPNEKSQAGVVLKRSRCKDYQLVLDEWTGQLENGHVRSAIAYLKKLVEKSEQGILEPEFAYRIEARRINRQKALEEKMKQRSQEKLQQQVSPEVMAVRNQARLAELRQKLGWRK